MSEKIDQSEHADKCPCCGGNSFIKGDVGPFRPTFLPESLGIIWKRLGLGESIRARKCAACGNLQFFSPIDQQLDS
jgi:hypothetical protein